MHRMVLVIGDDVDRQMNALMEEGWVDWWAPGGRYTGTLPLKPEATGQTFGDAMRPFERALADMMRGTGVVVTRGSDTTGEGVDRALVGDVDLLGITASALVQDGQVTAASEEVISPESNAVWMAMALEQDYLARGMEPPFSPPDDAQLAQAERERTQWRGILGDHLRTLPGETMLTVVDAHS
jgi:hypothetical protein